METHHDPRGPMSLVGVWNGVATPVFFSIEDRVDRWFDTRVGIETHERMHVDDLTITSTNTDFGDDEVVYVGIPVLALRTIDRFTPDQPETWTFVDLGSGKGRALFYAARHPYRRVIGVEFADELHEAAVNNIGSCRLPRQRCGKIETYHADAVDFEIPDGPCVFFLFNPFEERVMRAVMANIRAAHDRDPRQMVIVYHNPRYADVIDAVTGFERVWERTGSRRSECYDAIVYRSG